jgi:hypothetical protein
VTKVTYVRENLGRVENIGTRIPVGRFLARAVKGIASKADERKVRNPEK